MRRKPRTLVFDFDGVIASERRHWDAARLAVWELFSSPRYLGLENYFFRDAEFPAVFAQAKERVIPLECIAELKNKSVNSNWDITFFSASLHLIHLLSRLTARPEAVSGRVGEVSARFLVELGRELRTHKRKLAWSGDLLPLISTWKASSAYRLVSELNRTAHAVAGPEAGLFRYRREFWSLCQGLFQSWYTGAKLAQEPQLFVTGDGEDCWRRPRISRSSDRSRGLRSPIRRAGTVVALPRLRAVFDALQRQGYVLGIATGRPRDELLKPLRQWDLLRYFDLSRLSTYDEVAAAEDRLRRAGRLVPLSKPHPYAVLRALYPRAGDGEIVRWSEQGAGHSEAAVVGDSVGDVLAAKLAGCVAVGVLSGIGKNAAIRARREQCLREAGADRVIASVVELPGALLEIQAPAGWNLVGRTERHGARKTQDT